MNLQECLDKLARGKVSNLALATGGRIKEDSLPKVVDAVNEAIIQLYTKFPIKENSIFVELREGKTEYPLTSEHSIRKDVGDSIYDEWDYYIQDTDTYPFEDDIQYIVEVWDDLDRRRPLNAPDDPLSVFTPQPNVISVNFGIDCRVLNVIYRAKHRLLTPENLTEKIELPINLEGALLSYAAYLIHSDMNGEVAVANAQKYFAEYQMIVNEAINNGTLTPEKLVSDFKFIKRGWV